MVFQNYALYPHMTVADNMAFSMKLRRAPRAEIDKRVQRAAEILGLTKLLDRYPRQLSGGQRQRVAMGRAIVRDPQVFLFDEPLSNLDAKLRVAMRAEIKELHQRLKTTTVYVTHDQIEAMTMADKIVVMHDGIVEQIGAPLDLYDRPDNLFVAGFIGSPAMNFIRGRIEADGFVADGGLRLPLRARARRRGRPAGHLRHPAGAFPPDAGGHPGRGRGGRADRLGDPGRGEGRRAGDDRHLPRSRAWRGPGETIRVAPDPALVHLFDQESGRTTCLNEPDQAAGAAGLNHKQSQVGGDAMMNHGSQVASQGRQPLSVSPARPILTRLRESLGPVHAQWKPEQGAQLSMLRWKYFVQSEDDAFVALMDAFTKATGVKVEITRESYEDVQPKASVAANTGAGPDLFWGLYSLPHLFPQRCVDVTDVADHLGKKYGGWVDSAQKYGKSGDKWIAMPVCYFGQLSSTTATQPRRRPASPNSPRRPTQFLAYAKAHEGERHARRLRARPRLRRRQRLGALDLWSFGGKVVDENDKVVINSPETEKALDYAKQLYEHMVPGVASWNDSFNNKAFLAERDPLDQ